MRAVHPGVRLLVAVCVLCGTLAAAPPSGGKPGDRPSLKQALASLRVPPAWFAATRIRYDTSKPWKDARIEIRRLLGLGDPDSLHQAVKLTCIYQKKNDIGDGHEYPMYLYLGGETAWAIRAYEAFAGKLIADGKSGHTGVYTNLAACYRHFGAYDKAVKAASLALARLPDPPWDVSSQAHVHDVLGDLYAEKGDTARARAHYREAMRLYPMSKQPYGRHLLVRYVAKIQAKLDLLDMAAIRPGQLKDGTYTGKALGYVDEVHVTVVVAGGRIFSFT